MTSPADVATTLRRSTPDVDSLDYAQWAMWIDDAEMLIADRLGDLTALNQKTLSFVVREAVADRVKKPDDATQVEIAVDDARVSRRYSSSTGQITIRDEWWTLLAPATESSSGAFSIRPSFTPDCSWPR